MASNEDNEWTLKVFNLQSNDLHVVSSDAGMKEDDTSMASIESNEVCDDKDTRKEMTSNESNEVRNDAGIIDNDTSKGMTYDFNVENGTSREYSFEIKEKNTDNNRFTSPLRVPKIKLERVEGLEGHVLNSSSTNGWKVKEISENVKDGRKCGAFVDALESEYFRSQNAEGETKQWIFKVFNIQSNDLQVVASGNFDNDRITRDVGHRDDISIQNGRNEATTPAYRDESQQELNGKPSCEGSRLKKHEGIHIGVEGHQDRHAHNGSNDDTTLNENPCCQLCSLQIETSTEYHNHLKTHCIGKSCAVCQKVFSKRIFLHRHLRRHADIKYFKQCTLCNKTFKRKCNFERHKRNHAREVKIYNCVYCNKQYKQLGSLEKHVCLS